MQSKHTSFLIIFLLCSSFLLSSNALFATSDSAFFFGKKKVAVSVSEQDADVYVDGKLMGKGGTLVIIPKNTCINVRVEKIGFLNYEIEFCNAKGVASPPKSHFVRMQRDDAYDASVRTDIANIDIEVTTSIEKIGHGDSSIK